MDDLVCLVLRTGKASNKIPIYSTYAIFSVDLLLLGSCHEQSVSAQEILNLGFLFKCYVTFTAYSQCDLPMSRYPYTYNHVCVPRRLIA